MLSRILAALLCGCTVVAGALADTIVINDQVQVRESKIERPKRGLSMDEVEKQFGAPVTRHPAVGGGTPQHPPITRWDYKDFSVFFEHDHVIDSVVKGDEASPAPAPAVAQTPSPST